MDSKSRDWTNADSKRPRILPFEYDFFLVDSSANQYGLWIRESAENRTQRISNVASAAEDISHRISNQALNEFKILP